jgi:hypothetical protein
MARQQVVSYTVTCDVCGEEISQGEAEAASQKISWEGADYVVDMCASDRSTLDSVLGQLRVFVDAASEKATAARRRGATGRSVSKAKAGGTRGAAAPRSGARAQHSDMPAIRAWAVENGHKVGHRGRIPANVVAAYDQAQSAGTAQSPPKRRPRKAAATSA